MWNYCNADGNSEISVAELTACSKAGAQYVGMSDSTADFIYNFAAKYWNVVDQDGSGSLRYIFKCFSNSKRHIELFYQPI